MLKLVICTLTVIFIAYFVSEIARYHRYKSLTRKGVIGVKYNTPRKLFKILRNIGFVVSFCRKNRRV